MKQIVFRLESMGWGGGAKCLVWFDRPPRGKII